MSKKWRYMELNKIIQQRYGGREFLGKWIYWTEKRDGSCVAVWMKQKKKFLQCLRIIEYETTVSSRNQEKADRGITGDFFGSSECVHVIEYLKDNPTHLVFGELLRLGLSPTRIEDHKEIEFIVFDIFDGKKFLNYTQVHQQCYHYKMKCVELFGEGRFTTIESFLKYRDEMLKICKKAGREGVVLKTFVDDKPLYAKEKLDTATPRHSAKIERGQPKYPKLPDSEAQGAVDKAYADLGKKFADKGVAMPLIAKYIQEEMKKHKCSAPAMNFFYYYTKYAEDRGITIKDGKQPKPKTKKHKKQDIPWWKKLWFR